MKKNTVTLRGCIKDTRGPWVVHRTTKDGRTVSRLRFPSERERQNNKERERRRRAVSQRIFAGLRAHGNYQLPTHPDTNDLLIALCQEAGWIVQHDGTISRKDHVMPQMHLEWNQEPKKAVLVDEDAHVDCCQCHANPNIIYPDHKIDLSLSL